MSLFYLFLMDQSLFDFDDLHTQTSLLNPLRNVLSEKMEIVDPLFVVFL